MLCDVSDQVNKSTIASARLFLSLASEPRDYGEERPHAYVPVTVPSQGLSQEPPSHVIV